VNRQTFAVVYGFSLLRFLCIQERGSVNVCILILIFPVVRNKRGLTV
jgi:hypothetical protein